MNCLDSEEAIFLVVANDLEDLAIWPQWKQIPLGWNPMEGMVGDKASVLHLLESIPWREAQADVPAPPEEMELPLIPLPMAKQTPGTMPLGRPMAQHQH